MNTKDKLKLMDEIDAKNEKNVQEFIAAQAKAKYRLYDIYDNRELLGEFSSMKEVKACCQQRDLDTDGEWLPALCKYDKTSKEYRRFHNWHY